MASGRVARALSATVVLLGLACSEQATAPSAPADAAAPRPSRPSEPPLAPKEQPPDAPCRADADCFVDDFAGCCACPAEPYPASRLAARSGRSSCAAVDCVVPRCPPRAEHPARSAATCVDGRCAMTLRCAVGEHAEPGPAEGVPPRCVSDLAPMLRFSEENGPFAEVADGKALQAAFARCRRVLVRQRVEAQGGPPTDQWRFVVGKPGACRIELFVDRGWGNPMGRITRQTCQGPERCGLRFDASTGDLADPMPSADGLSIDVSAGSRDDERAAKVAVAQRFAAFERCVAPARRFTPIGDQPLLTASVQRAAGAREPEVELEAAGDASTIRRCLRSLAQQLPPPTAGTVALSVTVYAAESEVAAARQRARALRDAVERQRAGLADCMVAAPLRARAIVEFEVGTSGRVAGRKLSDSSLLPRQVSACLLAAVGKWTFPPQPRPIGLSVTVDAKGSPLAAYLAEHDAELQACMAQAAKHAWLRVEVDASADGKVRDARVVYRVVGNLGRPSPSAEACVLGVVRGWTLPPQKTAVRFEVEVRGPR